MKFLTVLIFSWGNFGSLGLATKQVISNSCKPQLC